MSTQDGAARGVGKAAEREVLLPQGEVALRRVGVAARGRRAQPGRRDVRLLDRPETPVTDIFVHCSTRGDDAGGEGHVAGLLLVSAIAQAHS